MKPSILLSCSLLVSGLAMSACSSVTQSTPTQPASNPQAASAARQPLRIAKMHLAPSDETADPTSVEVTNALSAIATLPITSETFMQGTIDATDPDAVDVDGEAFDIPPEDKSCPWTGNAPPTCGSSGAFRRIYSQPNATWVDDDWLTPATSPTWPVTSSVGHLYVEGWLNSPGNNFEAGFVYSRNQHRYLPYAKTVIGKNTLRYVSQYGTLLKAGQYVTVILQAVPCALTSGSCAKFSFAGTCAAADSKKGYSCSNDPDCQGFEQAGECGFQGEIPVSGWASGTCCIMASMMTIAQTANDFTVGNDYGPMQHYANAQTSQSSGVNIMTGSAKYPNNATKVITVQNGGLGTETEEIYLHS
jgi:hypothetical protein